MSRTSPITLISPSPPLPALSLGSSPTSPLTPIPPLPTHPPSPPQTEDSPPPQTTKTRFGRNTKKVVYRDSADSDDFETNIHADPDEVLDLDSGDEDVLGRGGGSRSKNQGRRGSMKHFVEQDDGDVSEDENGTPKRKLRARGKSQPKRNGGGGGGGLQRRTTRNTRGTSAMDDRSPDGSFHASHEGATGSSDAEGEPENLDAESEDYDSQPARKTRAPAKAGRATRSSMYRSESPQRRRELRNKERVNYALPPPPEEPPKRGAGGTWVPAVRKGHSVNNGMNGFLMDMSIGMGLTAGLGNQPDSDSDNDVPRKGAGADSSGMSLAGAGPKAGPSKAGLVGAPEVPGTVVNSGKFDANSALADADPLGVNLKVTFDEVGGLDDHINQLKEMVALPLLYPELYQQFGIIPPRGVLFHGPPGTGKTLLARALAASCSTSTTKISFFMRKGADCLSKWVGEAERQLRLLFEEARHAQPSIIFFDEIDGLAPVRSAKQDQIHASLVSTLLALMDGMDGRGQVIVIGATNRPDAVDPALRRPGRFDREFYFPLPNKVARRKIISINTKLWEPPLEDTFLDELAGLTKGYGGADLRALCTESALNAIQRRYPQVYKTSDRLLLDPTTVKVQPKDFMSSIRKIVPSSARAASSSAAPIPAQLVPLLSAKLDRVKQVVEEAVPLAKRPSVLEEAEWEDTDDGSFAREKMVQSFETLQVYRPRVLVHGVRGMGQRFLGSAMLHHLENHHVQNLDLASLIGQYNPIETIIVEKFVEAKRHQPSVIFIPALIEWANTVPETARATLNSLLDGLTSTEPVLLFALVEGNVKDLPRDVRGWFGYSGENLVEVTAPTTPERTAFFADLLTDIRRPPSEFPDGVPRRKRILEQLPLAPPEAPKPPSEAVIAAQKARDESMREILRLRLGPILASLRQTYLKKIVPSGDMFANYQHQLDHHAQLLEDRRQADAEALAEVIEVVDENAASGSGPMNGIVEHHEQPNGEVVVLPDDVDPLAIGSPLPEVVSSVPAPKQSPMPTPPTRPHYVDFDLMSNKLVDPKTGYLTTQAFIRDISKMEENAVLFGVNIERRQAMNTMVASASLLIKDHFQNETENRDIAAMAAREYERRAVEQAKVDKGKGKAVSLSPKQGLRQSARVNGHAPEFSMGALNEIQILRRKRSREGTGSSGDMQVDNPIKRARFEEVVDLTGTPPTDSAIASTSGRPGGPSAENGAMEISFAVGPGSSSGAASSMQAMLMIPEGGANVAVPPSSTTLTELSSLSAPELQLPVQGAAETLMDAAQIEEPAAAPVVLAPIREPTPPPPPPFIIPETRMGYLASILVDVTSSFNVEELEQLRATCLRKLWQSRTQWDRSGLVEDLVNTVQSFAMQVGGVDEDESM